MVEHRDDALGMVIRIDHENQRYTVTEFEVEPLLEHLRKTVRNARYMLEARSRVDLANKPALK